MHWWAIPAGLAAVSLPLVIHWLTRPRPTRMPLSTIRFVREILRQRQARYRLRDWLILLLRALAILALAAVIARPLSRENAHLAGSDGKSSTVTVVILDVSHSMGAVAGGIAALERARPLVGRHVAYRPDARVNLILAAANPQAVFDRPSTNFFMLGDAVARARPLPQRLNLQGALNAAAEMLAESDGGTSRRELWVISDFQRSNWSAADFSVLPSDVVIQLESVAPVETPHNLGLLRVGTQGRVEPGRPFRLEVDVGNYSPSPRQVVVEVSFGEAPIRLEGTATAGGRSTLVTEAVLPMEGWKMGTARLVGHTDALPGDDRRAVAIQVHPQPTFLLLTRQSAASRPSSSYFLERAIAPQTAAERGAAERIVRHDPARIDREVLAAADLLLLDHPGKLSEETLGSLVLLLKRGRGVLYVASEAIDATNLKLLAQGAGSSLQLPVEFLLPPQGHSRKNLQLVDIKSRDSPFKVFGEEASAILSPARFSGGLATRRVSGALLDDVLATYSDQSAALVMTACGAGELAVLNADLGTSSVTASPAFVPLVGELTSRLLGRERTAEAIGCGEPLAVYLPAAAGSRAGLEIVVPAEVKQEVEDPGELHEDQVGVMWQGSAAGPPGVYEIRRGTQTVLALASAIPAEESDLATLPSDLMTDRLAGGRDVRFRNAKQDDAPRDDLWVWFAIAGLGCVFVEWIGLKAFRS
ncbi:MAG: vWA domain-containing protein [Planctomycetales bacterium]